METLSTQGTKTLWADSNATAAAKAMASLIIPELETYRWYDNYFSQDKEGIIAVFDYDISAMSKALRLPLLEIAGVLLFYLFLFRMFQNENGNFQYHGQDHGQHHGQRSWKLLLLNTWFLEFLLLAISVACWRRITLIAPPHTAVTVNGVVHFTGESFWGCGGGK
jgi:hypothetical protein